MTLLIDIISTLGVIFAIAIFFAMEANLSGYRLAIGAIVFCLVWIIVRFWSVR